MHHQEVEASEDNLCGPEHPGIPVPAVQRRDAEVAASLKQVLSPKRNALEHTLCEAGPLLLLLLPLQVPVFGNGSVGNSPRGRRLSEALAVGPFWVHGRAHTAPQLFRVGHDAIAFRARRCPAHGGVGSAASFLPDMLHHALQAACQWWLQHGAQRFLLEGLRQLGTLAVPHLLKIFFPCRLYLLGEEFGRCRIGFSACKETEEYGQDQVEDCAAQAQHVRVQHEGSTI
mmetsp:Transcript_89498/g.248559  ORF Transcript_89498/g.248559 Transcript_89498/m.248559 type:complete len:229 (-) Transcript_89498:359-1045(-)